jgi:hypothetical protein
VIQVDEEDILRQHLRRANADDRLPQRVLAEARSLATQASYDAALEKYLWFHRHALAYNERLAGVRLSFALAEWVALGEQYPPARQALLSVRDDAAKAIANGQGSLRLFQEVAAINEYLQEQAQTVQLFKLMHQGHSELAGQCYDVAERVLIDRGEYAICVKYLPNLEQRLEALRQMYQMTLEIAAENHLLGSPEAGLKGYARLRFVEQTSRLIAILEGVGRLQDADRVRAFVRDTADRPQE